MANLATHRSLYAGFGNMVEYHRFIYDFAVDGGATGALTICTAVDNLVVVHAHAKIITTATSGGSATLIWGDEDDTNRFMTATQGAVASLTANAAIFPLAVEGTPNVLSVPFLLAATKTVVQTIATAALTAGKIEYVLGVIKM